MKINKIIKLSDAFATEVNVLRDYSYKNAEGNEQKIKGYLPNKSSRDIMKSILLGCPESTDKKLHLITSSFGTGKSYLLLMLANLLNHQNKIALDSLIEKIKDKEDYYNDKLFNTLENHIENTDPFLIVIPEYGDLDFDHALLEGLKYALQKNGIDYVPKTQYEEAIKTIDNWSKKNTQNYRLLKDLIKNNTIENFIEQLHAYNPGTYSEFKNYFKEIAGAPYSESHTSAYPVFADTAKEIRKRGFRGIAIIYDEFGEMLGKLINSSSSATGISVQQFLEDIKDKKENCNIIFVSASHQDPQSLRASKEKELNKIIGRFERHQLMVSEAEGEEIMGTIFIKEDPIEFNQIYQHPLYKEHLDTIIDFKLYPGKDSEWIENKVLKNLYPLHPLSSFILPRLSAEFAQNTRSMFNFLSPIETKEGAFKYYIETKDVSDRDRLNLFTPDLLLDFFLKNIKEDKEGRVQSLYEVYRVGIGKVTDINHQSIMKNLFMLCVVSLSAIQPKRDTLFWAMNWEESRRKEFHNLLDDLVGAKEYLELNPSDLTYQFPDFGAAPLSKIIIEENKKLDDISLSECLEIWKDIFEPEDIVLHDHNIKFGCNRRLWAEATTDAGNIISNINELKGFYNKKEGYFGSGFLFFLIGQSEDELEELKEAIMSKPEMLQYIIFATPINLPQFDNLITETLYYQAIENTAKRADVMQNPSRIKSIQDQKKIVIGKLEEKIKTLYEPANWSWNYLQEHDIQITSKPKLSNWVNQRMDHLFSETPTIKDEALWYTEGSKGGKDRKQALDLLLNSDKDRIPLRDDSSSAADKRILRNFFAFIGLTSDKKREKNVQYGEIKSPEQDSQVYAAWKHITNILKTGSNVNPLDIINPLLQEPFGLSENIIKFLITAYIRYDIERIIILDSKRKIRQNISLEVIEGLFSKPTEYVIRKIEITGPELRYLNQLKSLFDKQDVNTWLDVTQKFIGISQFLTPLQKGIIQESGDKDLQNFYKSLETLKAEFLASGNEKDKISQDYFQEHLPTILLNEGRTFIDDNTKVTLLVSKLDLYKKYPSEKESERKMEVIQALADDVFQSPIATKAEITGLVLNWFKSLPSPNQNGKFGNEIIKKWIQEIKIPSINDPFELYLETLNAKPIKDWENFSYEKYCFVSRFKDYKKDVEDYTKSPLEVLQIIARDVFGKSALECDSENAFDGFFKTWWDTLPDLHKAQQYSPKTNLLISQIPLPSAVKARYLETIPQVWKEQGFLHDYIPQQWESWSNDNAKSVAEKYHFCIEEVNSWKPPIELQQLFIALAKLFNDSETETISDLYTLVKTWQRETLSERTKNAEWGIINDYASTLFLALSDQDGFSNFIIKDAPVLWKLPEFKLWNMTVLETYLEKFQELKTRIEDYKRPLLELVEKIEENSEDKSLSTEEFSFNLYSKIKESDAYKNKIKTELLKNTMAVILYNSARKNDSSFTLINLINDITKEININKDWHLWTDKEEKLFGTNLKKGIDTLIKWRFPEAEKLKKAKVKVKQSIDELKKELALDDQQMRKVLNDILEDR